MMNALRDHWNKVFEIGNTHFTHVTEAVDEDRARLQLIDVVQKGFRIEFVGVVNAISEKSFDDLFVLKIAVPSNQDWAIAFLS